MSLKIIGGAFGGRNLVTLPNLDTRPTANRMREALFNILAFDIKGRRALDLFAGSGALGLEALSRGAASVTLVESSRKACEVIAKNIALCNVTTRARLVCGPVERFKEPGECYDLVLMDPPYNRQFVEGTLKFLAAANLLLPAATVVAEHEAGYAPVFNNCDFRLMQCRTYGKGALSFYKYKPFEATKL